MSAPKSSATQSGAGLLAGKIALVTGAGRGIGAAAGTLFAREGATVVLTARTGAELERVTSGIREGGGVADHVEADLSRSEDIDRVVQTVLDRHGRLDVAFNNAGTTTPFVPLVDLALDDLERALTVNVTAVFRAMAAEIRAIRASAGVGAIVNTSSVGSLRGSPRLAAYAATKRAVNSLTQTAAVECGPEGIRINAIAPGATRTAMIDEWEAAAPGVSGHLAAGAPLRRTADPVEIAEAALWLLSDRASFVTGVVLPVDGGAGA